MKWCEVIDEMVAKLLVVAKNLMEKLMVWLRKNW
jgi:hypothetical protein